MPEVVKDYYRLYIGKNGPILTLWMCKRIFSTKPKKVNNVMKIMPGSKMNARNAKKEVDTFFLFIIGALYIKL